MEILIIDDCGQDNSLAIVKHFLPSLGSKARIIKHSLNKGLGAARNSGIDAATGEFLLFLDSDDYLEKDVMDKLINSMKKNKTNLAIFNMRAFGESNKKYPLNPSFDLFDDFPKDFKLYRYVYPKYPKLAHSFSACNKLFKREIFSKDIRFPEAQHSEDALLMIQIIASVKSITFVKDAYYMYRQRESVSDSSITDTMFQKKEHFFEHLEISEGLKKLALDSPELEHMLLWVSLRIMGTPIRILLSKNILEKNDAETFYKRLKSLFVNRDIKFAYDQSISPQVVENTLLLLNSYTLVEAISQYEKSKYGLPQKVKRYLHRRIIPYRNILFKIYTKLDLGKQGNQIKSYILEIEKRVKKEKYPKTIILISERPTDAKDNGYWLFKYLRESHPELSVYYIIKRESPNYQKVAQLGNTVIYDSFEHENLFVLSDLLICTHTRGTIEPSFFDKRKAMKYYPEYYKKKYFFIQHGINLSGIVNAFSKNNTINANFSKIVCGAVPEYQYLADSLGYQKDVVVYTGLARYDSIMDRRQEFGSRNKILFMPTWRANICSASYLKEKQFGDDKFLVSEYYIRILEFLNHVELDHLLDNNNIELHFIPHPEVQKYLKYITTVSKNVKIVDPDTIDIQTELIEAKLLITDYSSVFFDFAYMKKPIIFYQHDYEEFLSQHYQKGYFDFQDHYFGDVVNDIEKLVLSIKHNIMINFKFSQQAEITHQQFFKYHDQNNCTRHYKEIKKLLPIK